jgi:hypothetical protein
MKFSRDTTPIPNSNRSNFEIFWQDPKKNIDIEKPRMRGLILISLVALIKCRKIYAESITPISIINSE